ncbi:MULTISPECIES: hypothetical protein [Burkholderia]|uniref:hypothetical protein n=1 Tax=Burkholderia TaxID=32008 RepID=UPI00126A5E02|nr:MULTISPECIES: hypothetical protein [Burkholderia]
MKRLARVLWHGSPGGLVEPHRPARIVMEYCASGAAIDVHDAIRRGLQLSTMDVEAANASGMPSVRARGHIDTATEHECS